MLIRVIIAITLSLRLFCQFAMAEEASGDITYESFSYELATEEASSTEALENLEIAANLGHTIVAVYKENTIPVYLPIWVNNATEISSLYKTNGVKLKKNDLVDVWTDEVKDGFFVAKKIYLKERPMAEKTAGRKAKKKKEDNGFCLASPDVPDLISRVVVDTFYQNVYVYGPNEEVYYVSRCVTGRTGWAIPKGRYAVKTKERNRYLDGRQYGEDYHLWVYYWMPFFGGAGLHDAGWRTTFWIDQRYYGSHGCINMPIETAKFIYENCTIGTPVIVR